MKEYLCICDRKYQNPHCKANVHNVDRNHVYYGDHFIHVRSGKKYVFYNDRLGTRLEEVK